MHETRDKDTTKSEILPPFVCGKTQLCTKIGLGGIHFVRSLQVEKPLVDSSLLLRFHDAVSSGRE